MTIGILDVYDFHRKIYDARWNGERELYVNFKQLEDELDELASKAGLTHEKIDEMLSQLYIPPYKHDLLPEHLKHSNSAKKETAGRPSLGETKKVSITLPVDIWKQIEKQIVDEDLKSKSAFFRKIALDHFKESV